MTDDDWPDDEPEDRTEEGPELARLRGDRTGTGAGAAADERPSTGFLVTLRARHDRPEEAVTRMRELLLATVPLMGEHEDDAALEALPEWFRRACDPGQLQAAGTRGWSAPTWLAWLQPDERSWWWWDGRADGPSHLVVDVLTHGHPYGSGSLWWLLRAVGCTELTEDGRAVDLPERSGQSARPRWWRRRNSLA